MFAAQQFLRCHDNVNCHGKNCQTRSPDLLDIKDAWKLTRQEWQYQVCLKKTLSGSHLHYQGKQMLTMSMLYMLYIQRISQICGKAFFDAIFKEVLLAIKIKKICYQFKDQIFILHLIPFASKRHEKD